MAKLAVLSLSLLLLAACERADFRSVIATVPTPSFAGDLPGSYFDEADPLFTIPSAAKGLRYTTVPGADYTDDVWVEYSAYAPLRLIVSSSLSAYAYEDESNVSPIIRGDYLINVRPVVPSRQDGGSTDDAIVHDGNFLLSLACDSAGATIRYTMDGGEPTEASTAYAGPIAIMGQEGVARADQEPVVVKAVAFWGARLPSAVLVRSFKVDPMYMGAVSIASDDPDNASTLMQTISLASADTEALIRYTLDGTAPTLASAAYSAPIGLFSTSTLRARAFQPAGDMRYPSVESSAAFDFSIEALTVSAASASFDARQTITLSCATPDAVIRYTLDGQDPINGSVYSAPFELGSNSDFHARAYAPAGYVRTPSNLIERDYAFYLANLVISPAPGSFESPQTISLSSATPDAVIRYTLDNTAPTTTSTAYTGPFALASDTVVRAIAFAPAGYARTPSTELSASYVFRGRLRLSVSLPLPLPLSEAGAALAFVSPPVSVTASTDFTVILSHALKGTVTYRWFLNGETVAGAGLAALSIGPAGMTGALSPGRYDLTVEALSEGFSYSLSHAFEVTP